MRKGKIMIIYHESSKTFHLYNNEISYIMCVLPNGHLGNLYFGKRIHDREDFSHLLEMKQRPMTACVYEGNRKFSLEHLKLEYPVYGSSDYRYPAVEMRINVIDAFNHRLGKNFFLADGFHLFRIV